MIKSKTHLFEQAYERADANPTSERSAINSGFHLEFLTWRGCPSVWSTGTKIWNMRLVFWVNRIKLRRLVGRPMGSVVWRWGIGASWKTRHKTGHRKAVIRRAYQPILCCQIARRRRCVWLMYIAGELTEQAQRLHQLLRILESRWSWRSRRRTRPDRRRSRRGSGCFWTRAIPGRTSRRVESV